MASLFQKLFRRESPLPGQVIRPTANDSAMTIWLNECIDIPGYRRFSDCPEIVAAVNAYADLISVMTIHLMENQKLGDQRINNALSRLVDIHPNPYMTKSTFYAGLIRAMLLEGDGNQVTVPVFDKNGLIDRLVPLQPSKVEFVSSGEGYAVVYDKTQTYQHDEILHFRINPDPEKPWLGTGYKFLLRDVIRSIRQAEATKESIKKRPSPSLVVRVDSNAEELASEDGRRTLAERYAPSQEAGIPWFIPADMMDVKEISPVTLSSLAIREDLELSKSAIAQLMGIPPFMLGVGEFNKAEHNNFIRTKIRQMAKVIEEELTNKLLIKPEWYFKLNARSLMAYDLDELISAGAEMVDRTAMDRNEWRDWVGMSPREDMKDLIVLENYLPIEKIGQQKKLKGEKDE